MLKLKDDNETSNVVKQPVSTFEQPNMVDDYSNMEDTYVSPSLNSTNTKEFENVQQRTQSTQYDNTEFKQSQNTIRQPQEPKKDNPLASAAVLIGFVAWIAGLFIFSKTEPKLCISLFGAFWLIIAIAGMVGAVNDGIKHNRNIVIAFVFAYMGVCLTFVPILQLYVPAFQGEFGSRLAMYLVFLFFVVTGLMFVGTEAYRIFYGYKVCSVEVAAECVKLKDENFWRDEVSVAETQGYYGRRKTVSGVYRFEYNGRTFEVQDDTNSNKDKPTPGEWLKIRINPSNPHEFYRQTTVSQIAFLVIGVAFLVVGILCFVVF